MSLLIYPNSYNAILNYVKCVRISIQQLVAVKATGVNIARYGRFVPEALLQQTPLISFRLFLLPVPT